MFELGNSLYAIQNRHRDVDDQNVRIQRCGSLNERGPVANSSNHVKVRRKHFGDAFEYGCMIIGKQNTHSVHWYLLSAEL